MNAVAIEKFQLTWRGLNEGLEELSIFEANAQCPAMVDDLDRQRIEELVGKQDE